MKLGMLGSAFILFISTIAHAERLRDVNVLSVGLAVNYVADEVSRSVDSSGVLVWPSVVKEIQGYKVTLETHKDGKTAEVVLGEMPGPGEIWTFEARLYVDPKTERISKMNEGFGIEINVGDIVSVKTSDSLFARQEPAMIVGMTNQGDATFNFGIGENAAPDYRSYSVTRVRKVLERRVASVKAPIAACSTY